MSLNVENISVISHGKKVVRNASIEVSPGKVTAVLGANGAGKSELALAIAGMLQVTQGSINVNGQLLTNKAPDQIRRAGVAVIPEGHRVLTKLSVEDNLKAAASNLSSNEVTDALGKVYELFPELQERRQQLAGSLSGGQQQMVAIGHGIIAHPDDVVIDEMALGLAPLIVNRLVATIKKLVQQGVGVILVEQFTEVALSIADTAVVMRTGETVFVGTSQETYDNPEILGNAYF